MENKITKRMLRSVNVSKVTKDEPVTRSKNHVRPIHAKGGENVSIKMEAFFAGLF